MPTQRPTPKPVRRRIYLMRHGAVDYIGADGQPVDPNGVALSAAGQAQADAAGHAFAHAGVLFDSVLTSGLPRTMETASRVLAAAGQALDIGRDERLQEIRPGHIGDLPREQILPAFLGLFSADADIEQHRFIGGESVGELLDRVLPAFDALLQRTDWQCLLLVLHGAVNRALIGRAMTGGRAFFGRLEQAPACINVIDAGPADLVVRSTNLVPSDWLQHHERRTTMEVLLGQFLNARIGAAPSPTGRLSNG
jgi:broad specificity phosphatase PhoE